MIDPVYCIRCKQPLDRADTFCRYCGADQRRPTAQTRPEQTVSIPASPQPPPTLPEAIPVYYKTCPVCGQPAVLSMPACGRCGAPYPPPFLPGASPFPPPAGSSPRRWSPAWVLIGVLLALLLAAARVSMQRSLQTPEAPDRAGSLVQSSGPFRERPSPMETPTITIHSTVPEETDCVFQDLTGHTYRLRIEADQTASIQMPAGDYDFQLEPSNPAVNGESGDATFRRFRAYDLTLTESPSDDLPPRGHIGDTP